MIAKNQIILNDVIYEFIQDKPKVDTCYKCSLQQICYEKMDVNYNRDSICNIFTNDEIVNGHFKIKE